MGNKLLIRAYNVGCGDCIYVRIPDDRDHRGQRLGAQVREQPGRMRGGNDLHLPALGDAGEELGEQPDPRRVQAHVRLFEDHERSLGAGQQSDEQAEETQGPVGHAARRDAPTAPLDDEHHHLAELGLVESDLLDLGRTELREPVDHILK